MGLLLGEENGREENRSRFGFPLGRKEGYEGGKERMELTTFIVPFALKQFLRLH